MNSSAHLAWPFFDESHRTFKANLQTWTHQQFGDMHGHDESRDAIDRECVSLVKALGQGGWLKPAIAGQQHGGRQCQQEGQAGLGQHLEMLADRGLADAELLGDLGAGERV